MWQAWKIFALGEAWMHWNHCLWTVKQCLSISGQCLTSWKQIYRCADGIGRLIVCWSYMMLSYGLHSLPQHTAVRFSLCLHDFLFLYSFLWYLWPRICGLDHGKGSLRGSMLWASERVNPQPSLRIRDSSDCYPDIALPFTPFHAIRINKHDLLQIHWF